jgi:protein-S-isoprenylcysteine O-methyltransferase Ste14
MIGRMRKSSAAVGSAVFLVLAPGTVAGLVPWLLTRWQPGHWASPVRIAGEVIGSVLVAAGAAVLLHAFARFALDGLGTPAPPAAPTHLVVSGVYRHVRNPMYLAVLAVIVGQALLLGRGVLIGYGIGVVVLFWAFTRWYEQPALARRFGEEFTEYRRSVPAWWPRLRPWHQPCDDAAASHADPTAR